MINILILSSSQLDAVDIYDCCAVLVVHSNVTEVIITLIWFVMRYRFMFISLSSYILLCHERSW